MKLQYKYLIASLLAPFTFAGVANGTLIGNSVNVSHSTGIGGSIGASPAYFHNITVADGINDLVEFQGPPQGQVFSGNYKVDVRANNVSVDFSNNTYFRGGDGPIEIDPNTGEPIGTAVVYSFNGLALGNLNDSSGASLQSVLVNTNILGWGSSRVNITANSVAFDWRGLGFTTADYFDAELVFAPPAMPTAPYTGPTLIGDSVTVSHSTGVGGLIGASPAYLHNITVADGINDLVEFQGPPQGQVFSGDYKVDVRANNVSVDFSNNTYFRGGDGPIEIDSNTGEPIGTAVVYSFNGLALGNLNSSTGAAIQSVSVNTDMAGWNDSRVGLNGDSVSFNWVGLGNATYFDATFNYASENGPGPGSGNGGNTSVPEPSTLLLFGSGIAGFALMRLKRSA